MFCPLFVVCLSFFSAFGVRTRLNIVSNRAGLKFKDTARVARYRTIKIASETRFYDYPSPGTQTNKGKLIYCVWVLTLKLAIKYEKAKCIYFPPEWSKFTDWVKVVGGT